MRFQELRDPDGTVVARGLHPAIAVVSAGPVARAATLAALSPGAGCLALRRTDVQGELERAAVAAVEEHKAAVEHKRRKISEAEQALQEAASSAEKASVDAAGAAGELARFDEMSRALVSAEETYESAVRADAEAARALAAALDELNRILGQRHSASVSLEQARRSRDNRGVPEAVLQQAMNLQAALAKAEAEKRDGVQQADDASQAARTADRDALLDLESAHTALRAWMSSISPAPPNWGAGVPLPGLVASYRDRLAASASEADAAEAHAKGMERASRARVEQERRELEALEQAEPAELEPRATIENWLAGDHFDRDQAVFADEAFSRFGTEGAAALITTLAGRGCQVIYLTEDAELLSWAIALPHEAGGASTISSSRSRKPALVGD